MFQFTLATILFIAGVAVFLSAPITLFLGQKRGNWDMSNRRLLRYLGLSQLGVTIVLVVWVVVDFQAFSGAMIGFSSLAIVHILAFTIYWSQKRWLAGTAKKLREKPHWL